jgi:hypothetical protein
MVALKYACLTPKEYNRFMNASQEDAQKYLQQMQVNQLINETKLHKSLPNPHFQLIKMTMNKLII